MMWQRKDNRTWQNQFIDSIPEAEIEGSKWTINGVTLKRTTVETSYGTVKYWYVDDIYISGHDSDCLEDAWRTRKKRRTARILTEKARTFSSPNSDILSKDPL